MIALAGAERLALGLSDGLGRGPAALAARRRPPLASPTHKTGRKGAKA
jgi:hypothetical protein